MDQNNENKTCSCCGEAAAACEEPIEFGQKFRYWIIRPENRGRPPTGSELVHAATNDTAAARLLLNALYAAGIPASGWDNSARTWFISPEMMAESTRVSHSATRH